MSDYIDINLVEKKLRELLYPNAFSFYADIRKIWERALKFGKEDPDLSKKTKDISTYFE